MDHKSDLKFLADHCDIAEKLAFMNRTAKHEVKWTSASDFQEGLGHIATEISPYQCCFEESGRQDKTILVLAKIFDDAHLDEIP